MNTDSIFIIYFRLKIEEWVKYKSLVKATDRDHAKKVFFNKLDKEFPIFEINNVRIFNLNKDNYKGKRFSDKEWDILLNLCYPNHKGKLFKFKVDDKFGFKTGKLRNENGTFKKGFSPWNKNLKIKMIKHGESGKFSESRTSDGKFKKGIKPMIVGAKNHQ